MPHKSVPEDFKNVENKFKLSILNMEKRFLDLEVAVSELSEKVNAGRIDSVKEINEKIAWIEDLILVEQAGITELKNVMEIANNRFQTINEFDDRLEKKVSERVDEIEKKVNQAQVSAIEAEKNSEAPVSISQETQRRVAAIEQDMVDLKRETIESINPLEFGELRNSLNNFGDKIDEMEKFVGTLKASIDLQVEDAVKEALRGTTGKGADFEFIKANMDSIKKELSKIKDSTSVSELKRAKLDEKLKAVEERVRDAPKKAFDEIKGVKRDIETAKVKVESLESILGELNSNVKDLEDKAESFKSVEQITDLKKEIDRKTRKFRNVKDGMEDMSNKVQVIYNEFEKRMMNFKNQEKDIKDLSDKIKGALKDIEEVRSEMEAKTDRAYTKRVSNRIKNLEKSYDQLPKLISGIKNMRKDLDDLQSRTKSYKDVGRTTSELVENVDKRISAIETKLKDSIVERKSFDNIRKELKGMERIKENDNAIKKLGENLAEVLNEIGGLKKSVDMKTGKREIGKIAENMKGYDVEIKKMSEDMKTVSDLKSEIEDIRSSIGEFASKDDVNSINSVVMENIENRANAIESIVKENMVEKKEIDNVISKLSERVKDVSDMMKGMDRMERELSIMRKETEELPEEFKVTISDIASRMTELEKTLQLLDNNLKDLAEKPETDENDAGMKELVDRLIFLETRMSTIESMMEKPQPIILE